VTTDRLDELVECYREETLHRERDAHVLRARVLGKLAARGKVLRPRPWLVPLFAVLIGTGALAATSSRAMSRLGAWLHPAVTAPPEGRAKGRPLQGALATEGTHGVAARRDAVAVPVLPSLSRPEVLSLEALPVDAPARAPAPHAATVASPAAAVSLAEERAPSEELTLYRAAHDLHFGGGTPTAALSAFRRYLERYPDGTLAAEARFNEAVCLARLGRKSDARAHLAPFATGAYGAHFRSEARALLAVLGDR